MSKDAAIKNGFNMMGKNLVDDEVEDCEGSFVHITNDLLLEDNITNDKKMLSTNEEIGMKSAHTINDTKGFAKR